MKLSIIVPVFNEEPTLPELVDQLVAMLEGMDSEYEMIFVDDGSTDRSRQILEGFSSGNERIRVLSFTRNFGQQAALLAGMEHSTGDAVITMDADLQHPPSLVPLMVAKWQQGAEVVLTRRENTSGLSRLRVWTSSLFYRLLNRLSATNVVPGASDFRLLDRAVVHTICELGEQALFLRGMIGWMGFRQEILTFKAPARRHGTSKYSLLRMLRFGTDGITAFSSLPLYFSALLGLAASLAGFGYLLYALVVHFATDRTVPGWTSVVGAVLVIGGVQLVVMGIHGAYLARIFNETKGRPRYILRPGQKTRSSKEEK